MVQDFDRLTAQLRLEAHQPTAPSRAGGCHLRIRVDQPPDGARWYGEAASCQWRSCHL